MSNIGKPCARQLYLEKMYPNEGEQILPHTYMKFVFGDLTEEFILFLAELAGHRVELRQQEIKIEGIVGHWDAVIDGHLIDVKSASKASFEKFQRGLKPEDDGFGYLTQLKNYFYEARKHSEVLEKNKAGFLVFDKVNGHICLDLHEYTEEELSKVPEEIIERKNIINGDVLPDRAFQPIPEGKSGNMKLPFNCSYCSMKFKCYDNIRSFLYSYGPVHLTHVAREPQVYEIPNASDN